MAHKRHSRPCAQSERAHPSDANSCGVQHSMKITIVRLSLRNPALNIPHDWQRRLAAISHGRHPAKRIGSEMGSAGNRTHPRHVLLLGRMNPTKRLRDEVGARSVKKLWAHEHRPTRTQVDRPLLGDPAPDTWRQPGFAAASHRQTSMPAIGRSKVDRHGCLARSGNATKCCFRWLVRSTRSQVCLGLQDPAKCAAKNPPAACPTPPISHSPQNDNNSDINAVRS